MYIARAADLDHHVEHLCSYDPTKLDVVEIRGESNAKMSEYDPTCIHGWVVEHWILKTVEFKILHVVDSGNEADLMPALLDVLKLSVDFLNLNDQQHKEYEHDQNAYDCERQVKGLHSLRCRRYCSQW